MKVSIHAIAAMVVGSGLLAACGTTNNFLADKSKTTEYYRIFDLKTTATRSVMSTAASDGLGQNVRETQETTPVPTQDALPETPGRFTIVDPFHGSGLAALAGPAAAGMRVAQCDGASWTATAQSVVEHDWQMRLTLCLFPYQGGYHLDMYGVFTKQEGGLMQISRAMTAAVMGSPEQWAEKVMTDTVRTIRQRTAADVVLLEAQPDQVGMPWLDGAGS